MARTRLIRIGLIVFISCAISGALMYGLRTLNERSALSYIRARCDRLSGSEKDSCVVSELARRVIGDGSVSGAYRIVERMAGGKPHFGDVCSRWMSNAGREAYDIEPNYTNIDFGPESTHCNYGFVQSYVREMTLVGRDPERSRAFCTSVAQTLGHLVPGATQECYRGIGQSLPFVEPTRAREPDTMMVYSISTCESLTSNAVYQKFCISGAFQYLDFETSRRRYGLVPEQPDPLAICKRQAQKYADLCFGNMKRVVLGPPGLRDESDYAATMRDVHTRFPHLSTDTLQVVTHTLAYDDVYATEPDLNYVGMVHKCSALESNLLQWCIWGAATGISKNAPTGLQVGQIKQLCEAVRSVIGESSASDCISPSAIEFLSGTIPHEELLPLCDAYTVNVDCKNR